jgi:hypothetical protein
MNQGIVDESNKLFSEINAAAPQAAASVTLSNEQAQSLLSAKTVPVLQGGLAPIFEPWIRIANSGLRAMGVKEDDLIQGLGDNQIATKLQVGQASISAQQGGREGFQLLQAYLNATANPTLEPKAIATLLAQNAIASVQLMDKRRVVNEAKNLYGNVEVQPILTAFDNEYSPDYYSRMRDTVRDIYMMPQIDDLLKRLSSNPNSKEYADAIGVINRQGERKGIPNLSRVFLGR